MGKPLNGIRNVGGPEKLTLDELGRIALAAKGDKRTVVVDHTAGMFAAVKGDVLTHRPARCSPPPRSGNGSPRTPDSLSVTRRTVSPGS